MLAVAYIILVWKTEGKRPRGVLLVGRSMILKGVIKDECV
jgi:hypothetical protein